MKKLFCAILTCVCLNASAATDFDKWFGILKQDPVGTTYGVTSKKDGSFVAKTPIKTFEVKKTAKNTYEVLGMTVGVKQHNSYTYTFPPPGHMEGEHPQGHGGENGKVKGENVGIESRSMVGTLRAASENDNQGGRYT